MCVCVSAIGGGSFSFMHIEQLLPALRAKYRVTLGHQHALMVRRRAELREERYGPSSPVGLRRLLSTLLRPERSQPRQARKPKNVTTTEKIMRLSEAVVALTVHFQQVSEEQREEEEERRRVATKVAEFMKSRPGHFDDRPEPSAARWAADNADSQQATTDARGRQTSLLVRDRLCAALLTIFGHGFNDSPSPSYPRPHIWDFIQAASAAVAQSPPRPRKVTGSQPAGRLSVHKDDLSKDVRHALVAVFAAVQSIEDAHQLHKNADKNAKFRVFIRIGLNSRCLDAWFEVLALAASRPPCASWFTMDSFLRSPAWRQIKDELSKLSKLPFHLSIESGVA